MGVLGRLLRIWRRPVPGAADSAMNGNGAHRRLQPYFRFRGAGAPGPEEVDRRFAGLVLGVNSLIDEEPNPFERRALRRFEQIVGARQLDPDLIPRPPGLLPHILSLIRRSDYHVRELALEVARDTTLVADVLRLANSPWYRTGRRIESLEQALVMIGEEGMRQIVSSATLRPVFQGKGQQGHFCAIATELLWQQSLLASRAADCIAEAENAERFPAFLAGLVSTTGLLALIRELDRLFTGEHAPRSLHFSDRLLHLGRQLSVRIAENWQLPESSRRALESRFRHQALTDMPTEGQILFVAEQMARMNALQASGRYRNTHGEVRCRIGRGIPDSCSHCYRRLMENPTA